jgi:membrane-bound serine protease (ClpP class)
VSYQIVVPVALGLAGILLVLSRLAVTAHRMRPVTGAEGLIGAHGRTLTDITPDLGGQINLHGEIWRAASRVPLSAGHEVRVTALSGLTVFVEPVNASVGQGETT